MQLSMSTSAQESFLAEPRVGIFSFNQGGDSPLMTPMWFFYEAGSGLYWFMTDAESRKGKLLFVGSPISMLAQKDTQPHKYVSVRGKVAEIAESTEHDWAVLARHYALDSTSITDSGLVNPITISVDIGRWTSYDESSDT